MPFCSILCYIKAISNNIISIEMFGNSANQIFRISYDESYNLKNNIYEFDDYKTIGNLSQNELHFQLYMKKKL